ncbi:MAG: flavodoxin [Acutalibacteraceae bacterium]
MKKIFSFIMSFLLILTLGACAGQSPENSGGNQEIRQTDSETAEAEKTLSESKNEASGGKTLVVYFSATGNTKEAAEYIASATGGDLFELIPAKPYSSEDLNWNDENSRVVYEHNHPDERDVALNAVTVENFNEYDTVFIG